AASSVSREEGLKHFSLAPDKKTVLIVGGSLGARSINLAIDAGLDKLLDAGLQLIWQTGKLYVDQAAARTSGKSGVWTSAFINEMEKAYAAADIVVSRSGAMSVAELCVAGKPAIFVPFPFAAEDHQTANAKKLVDKHAAMMVKDSEVMNELMPLIISTARNDEELNRLKKNISAMAVTNADKRIAEMILNELKS